jgi:hypothetical protein
VGLLAAFLLGLLGSPLAERQARRLLPAAFHEEVTPVVDPRVDQLSARLEQLEADAQADASLEASGISEGSDAGQGLAPAGQEQQAAVALVQAEARLDALAAEVARMAQFQDRSEARVRDLFLLSVARRMLEAGRPLTPVMEPVRQQFGVADAAAVDALKAWSAAPQTRTTLAARLETLRAAPQPQGSLWERLRARLLGMVRVRGADEPLESADATAQLAEARTHLRNGDLELAVAAVRGSGDTVEARQWSADAGLLLAAEDALARLDSAALARAVAAATPAVGATPPGELRTQ